MSDFENLLKKTCEASGQGSLEEYADGLAKVISIKINEIFERYSPDILSLDENLRNRIKSTIRERFEKSINEVKDPSTDVEL
jgi:hypothetical protein